MFNFLIAALDDILFHIPRAPIRDVLGGAGSYAAMGARLFRKNPHSCQVSWVVHRGSDFPAEALAEIKSWGTRCHLVETPKRLTTRGLNIYKRGEQRGSWTHSKHSVVLKLTVLLQTSST